MFLKKQKLNEVTQCLIRTNESEAIVMKEEAS